jgi:hypothetical protein
MKHGRNSEIFQFEIVRKLSSIVRFVGRQQSNSFEFTRALAMASPSVDFLVTKDPEANSKGVPSAIFIVRIQISLAGSLAG